MQARKRQPLLLRWWLCFVAWTMYLLRLRTLRHPSVPQGPFCWSLLLGRTPPKILQQLSEASVLHFKKSSVGALCFSCFEWMRSLPLASC